jgi:hypothetical protein
MPDETKRYGSGQPLEAPGRVDLGRVQTEMASPAPAATVAAIPTGCALDATVSASPVRFSQPASLELAAGTTVGEYRVLHKLGEGGMGAVYAGEQPTIGKGVAIKVLAPHCDGPDTGARYGIMESGLVPPIASPPMAPMATGRGTNVRRRRG